MRKGRLALCAETQAAFRSSGFDDISAAFGAHARPESVIALALDDTGLECSLHGFPVLALVLADC